MNAPVSPHDRFPQPPSASSGWVLVAVLVPLLSIPWLVSPAEMSEALPAADGVSRAEPADSSPASEWDWMSLFDGRTLDGWEITEFGGEGDVLVRDGQLLLEIGADLTGVHTNRPLPRIDYEVAWKAMRVAGSDFFSSLTFPVKGDPCTLVLGGWGGWLCGLSSLDGLDASENSTTTGYEFENGKWYRMRLRVTAEKIEAWVDDEQIIDQEIGDRQLSIRWEVEPSQPFGFATWRTTGALRDIRLRRLPSDELPPRQ